MYATRTRRGNKIRAGEREEESARIHVLVRAGREGENMQRQKEKEGEGESTPLPSNG